MPRKKLFKLDDLLVDLATLPDLFAPAVDGGQPFFRCSLQAPASDRNAKLVVVTGDNASGKSFWCKAFGEFYTDMVQGSECIRLGLSLRADPHRGSWIYSPIEDQSSSGAISARVALTSFEQCSKRDGRHILVLDEPDLGLSESYAAALGSEIARFAAAAPDKTDAVVVVSHSRGLLHGLRMAGEPVHVRLGDERTLDDIITALPQPKTAEELAALPERGRETFHALQRWLKGVTS